VVRAFEAFAADPRPGEVYNIGGGRANSASVLESLALVESLLGGPVPRRHLQENRRGDHICYISDTRKLRAHYPSWTISRSLEAICGEIIEAQRTVLSSG
jgi:CDP-paratose 2-epimerase